MSHVLDEEVNWFGNFLRKLKHGDFLKLLRLLQDIPKHPENQSSLNQKIASVHLILLSISSTHLRGKSSHQKSFSSNFETNYLSTLGKPQVPQNDLEQLCSLLSTWIYKTTSHQLKELILAVFLKLVQESVSRCISN